MDLFVIIISAAVLCAMGVGIVWASFRVEEHFDKRKLKRELEHFDKLKQQD